MTLRRPVGVTFNTRREHQSYLQESHDVYSLSKAISKVDSKRQGQFKMQRPLNSRKKSEQMGKLRTRPAFQGKEECHGRQNHERRRWGQGPVGNDPLAWVLNQERTRIRRNEFQNCCGPVPLVWLALSSVWLFPQACAALMYWVFSADR